MPFAFSAAPLPIIGNTRCIGGTGLEYILAHKIAKFLYANLLKGILICAALPNPSSGRW